MSGADVLSIEATRLMFGGLRDIPGHIAETIDMQIDTHKPLGDPDQLSAAMQAMAGRTPEPCPDELYATTYKHMLMLGASSLKMAHLLAGDVGIPRPRRLHEHNQSTTNVYLQYLYASGEERDRILVPMFALQDIGKSLCVALEGKSKNQSRYNTRLSSHILRLIADDVLTTDEKQVIQLLVSQSGIGSALYRHSEKGWDLETSLAPVTAELSNLQKCCPDDYRDRFDHLLHISYLGDAGGHTQRAYYIDATSGKRMQDVKETDRFTPDGKETMRTLDRLFSEAPEHSATLQLHQPAHLAVMRQLFPAFYE